MASTREKNCYCYTCNKAFHYLGIARHRKKHMEKDGSCVIGYSGGEVYKHTPRRKGSKK